MSNPTPEQVEAAASAIHDLTQGDPLGAYHPAWQERRRAEARAALTAAGAVRSLPAERAAAARGFAQGVARALQVTGIDSSAGCGLLTLIGNPYQDQEGERA